MKLLTFDHLILITDDLEATSAGFAEAGFSVITRADGGTGPSVNRLVVFPDGSYLEILAFVDAEYGARHRLRPLLDAAGGPAWGDWSLLVDQMPGWTEALETAGVANSPSPDYAKSLEDGRQWSLKLLQIGRGVGIPELPFLVSDNTPHNLRVPDETTQHANGATAIAGLSILTAVPAAIAKAMDVMMPGTRQDQPLVEGAAAVTRWSFGPYFVDLVTVAPSESDLQAQLARRGPSIRDVYLHSTAGTGLLSLSSTRGCRTILI